MKSPKFTLRTSPQTVALWKAAIYGFPLFLLAQLVGKGRLQNGSLKGDVFEGYLTFMVLNGWWLYTGLIFLLLVITYVGHRRSNCASSMFRQK